MLLRFSKIDEDRLDRLAHRRGCTKASYAREIILTHIEDQEDVYEAERILRRLKAGRERTYALNEAARRLGLDC
jgi:RHH-type rel operon transcriptional repressor/antitoxin RelB